ncbi:hypothetical protein M8A51_03965 [Schlegelella sp. S2-27]|uniref:MmyB-like transcription regulator ligand binding domain-containing protein n=1 Tax=Caldimonas mangrovi TaxID=2944811 RepID=A0ABT0YIY9_9BURK|nr:hypothetical protein [Caldimonas mangrovi]MCM5678687.1 hypothetical protein [Caldimonas mangrovi]
MREVDAPRSLCNVALLLAGYAPTPVLDPAAKPQAEVEALLHRTISLHHPSPGLVFNQDWWIVGMNPAARRLCELLMPEVPREADRLDMLASLVHPSGWLSRARQPVAIAAALLAQLRVEQWARPALGPRVDAVETALRGRYGALDACTARAPSSTCLNIVLDTPLGVLSFSAIQTVVGLPPDTAWAPLRAELWFPVDAATVAVLQALDSDTASAESRPPAAQPAAA